ncbi:hypothetical protein ONZ43_g91 [Nemania bipapillata]|uniref:Uncharacterized protein n=1 Tax=Nemania bipapillata TaxID=110536 RepID=A0ACC2J9D4_9PEZI|nr:hypothetical protein ONZ43_g91 [Nemania bipapillata]
MQSLIDKSVLKLEPLSFIGIIAEGLDDYTTNAQGDIGSLVRLEAIRATKTLWQTRECNQELVAPLFPQLLRLAAEKLDRVRAEAKLTLTAVLQSRDLEAFGHLSFTSKAYFSFLLALRDRARLRVGATDFTLNIGGCTSSLLAGLVTSADTGNEDLVIETRAALAELCQTSDEALHQVCASLLYNLKLYAGQDRVLVPTLGVIAYLFHAGLLQRCYNAHGHVGISTTNEHRLNLKDLCLLVQKAAYKTGNMRKLEACIKVYGAIATIAGLSKTNNVDEIRCKGDDIALAGRLGAAETSDLRLVLARQEEGVAEARKRLGALLHHPWPRVRTLVVDELWNLFVLGLGGNSGTGRDHGAIEAQEGDNRKMKTLLGVDWGKAGKPYVKKVVKELGLE